MATFLAPDIDAALKEHVNPVLFEQFEQARTLYNMIGEAGEPVNSRGTRLTSRVRQNPSFTWFSEAGAFPTPGKQTYIEMKVFTTRCAVGYDFSGDFLDQVDTPENLVAGLTRVLSDYTDTAKKKINQSMYGDGTGEIAVVVSRDSATQATLATTTAQGSLFGARKLDVDAEIHWFSSAGVQRTAGGALSVVTGKTESTGVATFDATNDIPTDVVATDILVHSGSFNKAVLGLKRHVNNDNGAYQGQSRSDFSVLKAGVDDANGAALTTARLNKNKYAIRYRIASEDAMNVTLITSPTQYELYSRIGFNLIRFQGGGGNFRQDFDTVSHGNSTWVIDVDCDDDRLYGVDLNGFKRYVLRPFGYFDDDTLNRRMFFSNGAGSDKYSGWLGVKFNLGCSKPNANFVITELSVTDGAVGFSSLG